MHQIHLQTGDLTLPSFLNRLVSEIPLLPLHSTPQPLLPLENFLLAPRSKDVPSSVIGGNAALD